MILGGVLGCTFYRVGPHKFSSMFFTEEILKTGLSAAGFAIVEFTVEPRVFKTNMEDCDFSGKYVILARKEKEV